MNTSTSSGSSSRPNRGGSDQLITAIHFGAALLLAAVAALWNRHRARTRYRRGYTGAHQLLPGTYYGYRAASIVLRERNRRQLFQRLHDDTETLILT